MSWTNRLLNLLRSRKLSGDLNEEIEFHLEARSRDNLAAGMTPDAAHQDAALRFGNRTVVKERARDMNILTSLETVLQDLRYALRGFRRSPGFAVTAILSLALGIGASVSIFTVADNLLLRPLPYRDPSRLMMIWEQDPSRASIHNVIAPRNYIVWKARTSVFESMAVWQDIRTVVRDGERAEELVGQSVSGDLFPLLGVQPLRGRGFTAEEDRPGPDPNGVIVISYRLWQNWFGAAENTVGRKLIVNGTPSTIIGILPPSTYLRDRNVDLWRPLRLNPATVRNSGRYLLSVARLKAGVTRDQAQAEMAVIAKGLEAADDFDKNWGVEVEPLRDSMVREVKASLLILLGAVGLLLAVACANVANLLLARYTSRRQEMVVRASLGAGRWRVVRQLLTESVLLGVTGGLLGVLLARWAVIGLLALAPADLTRSATVVVDFRILLFAVALSVLAGIVFGIAPSLLASRAGLADALKDGSRSSTSNGRLRGWLVGAEVALSVMLLAGAGLLFRSVVRLQAVEPGLQPAGVLTFRVSLPGARYQGFLRRAEFFNQAMERIRQLPGVQLASAVSHLPFTEGVPGTYVNIAGRPQRKPGEEYGSVIRTVMPGYFKAMGIPLTRGRDFTNADNVADTPHRFIVNDAFVKKFLDGQDPLETSINAWMDTENPYGQIVGVVGDVKEGALDKKPEPTVYYTYAHLAFGSMNFVVRAQGNLLALAEPVRRIVRGIDPAQPVAEIRTMEDIVGQTFARQRFSSILLVGFSIAALLLAAVGIYGVLAYSVSERARELGVRLALGAVPANIVAMVVWNGARLVLVGIAIGVAGAFALSGLLRTLLYGVGPRDPLTFLAAPLVLIVVALLAAYLPARRASRLDPAQVLRAQ